MSGRQVLAVLCGIPGSGKSTWAQANARWYPTLISFDALREDPRIYRKRFIDHALADARESLGRGVSVLVDACSTQRSLRVTWLRVAQDADALSRLVLVHCPLYEAVQRLKRRGDGGIPFVRMQRYDDEWNQAAVEVSDEGWDEVLNFRALVLEPAIRQW